MTDEIDLGSDHKMVFSEYDGQKRVGAEVHHKREDGQACVEWVPFEGRAWANSFKGAIATWRVEQDEPITISPSIACRVCGDHGFIKNGRWEKA